MEKNNETALAIYHQICQVNDLDPQAIQEKAQQGEQGKQQGEQGKQQDGEQVEKLILAAFRQRANALVADLGIGSGSELTDGKEYSVDGDPAAPSFTINEDYIRETYPANEAEKIIGALGQVQLPIRA